MTPPPVVSVLLPVRNARPFLGEALDSLAAQTLEAFEVVAVDDGSSDGSGEVLEARARRDPRLRVLRRPARGLVPALEEARRAARAPLLARMDADDVAAPARLEHQRRALEEDPGLGGVGCRVEHFPSSAVADGTRRYQRWLNGLVTPEEVARDLFVECPLAHPTLLVRAEALEEVGGYRDRGWPEDYDLVLRLWRQGWRLANVPRRLLRWREHPGRASRVDGRYSLDAFRRCKVHHLTRSLLPTGSDVAVWGAGPTGKAFARELRRAGHRLRGFIDVDPRKIGQEVHGAPVLGPEDCRTVRDAFLVGAVSGPGPRREIRVWAGDAGWREMEDFVVVA